MLNTPTEEQMNPDEFASPSIGSQEIGILMILIAVPMQGFNSAVVRQLQEINTVALNV